MEIIAHRGLWKTKTQQNTVVAFRNALRNGFGVETDLRDQNGEIVISHGVPNKKCLTFDAFLNEYKAITKRNQNHPFLALNIKSDGLQKPIKNLLKKYDIMNYFVFDMSAPDTIGYLQLDIKTYARQSEFESEVIFYDQIDGIWLDQFQNNWVTGKIIQKFLDDAKQVCIVSPELHNRQEVSFWNKIIKAIPSSDKKIMICTDYPERAEEFFNG